MIDQEKIFSKALGFYPQLRRRYTSPFRSDRKPGCFVDYKSGWLRWFDWGAPEHNYANAWDIMAIAKWGHKIRSPYEKEEITEEIRSIGGGSIKMVHLPEFKQDISFKQGAWKAYWEDYGITYEQLEEDGVFPVYSYKYNSRENDIFYKQRIPDDPCFAYTWSDAIKIYRPHQKERYLKWKTNCKPDHVHFDDMKTGSRLILCGSYKDARVVKNEGFNVRGLQSENQLPNPSTLKRWAEQYEQLYWLGDNDQGGQENTKYVISEFKKLGIVIKPLYLWKADYGKDISDFKKSYNAKTISHINWMLDCAER